MLTSQVAWDLACELARSGSFANVVMIEKELQRRGVLNGAPLTTQAFRRELLTRVCHAARNGEADPLPVDLSPRAFGGFNFAIDLS